MADSPGGEFFFVDLHVHSSASFDSLSQPAAIVRAAASRGLTHVAITVSDLGRSVPWYEKLIGAKAVLNEDTMSKAIHDVYCGIMADHEHPNEKDRDQARAMIAAIRQASA